MVEKSITDTIKDLVFYSLDNEEEVASVKNAIKKVKDFIKTTEKNVASDSSWFINEPISISDDENNEAPNIDDSNSKRYKGDEVFSNSYNSRFDILKDVDTIHLSNKILFSEKTADSSLTAITRSGISFSY